MAAGVGAGYWWGIQEQTPPGAADAMAQSPDSPTAKDGRKIRFYRNPMGLPDTSPVPKKDPMGMDYIPVYEGEEEPASSNQIKISTEKVQKLGVRTESASMRSLTRTVRAVGTLAVDERRINTVAPKFEGWIERLYVNTTGQQVARGQPLMDVYSPDLVTAQQEYLIAARAVESLKDGGPEIQSSMRRLMTGSLERLRNWDISEQDLQELAKSGAAVRRTITLRSPVTGVVIEKPALKGMRFMPGEALYQISDLSGLWLLADIFEQDLGLVRPGQAAKITVEAFPGKTFSGKVSFLYPTITSETRTGKVRIELPNPGGLLKPSMYASVELAAGQALKVLTVPNSAVIDSGVRRIVLVQLAEGRFEPREVKLGARADEHVEVLEGVKAGEQVVVAANFLIDAESNLKAAIGGLGHGGGHSGGSTTSNGESKPAQVSHHGEGTVEGVDAKAGTVSITHGPIPTLKWPSMTMEFMLANASLAANLKPGAAIAFEMIERKPGEYVVTRIEPKGAPKPAASHSGH